jgi:hypothetical protein
LTVIFKAASPEADDTAPYKDVKQVFDQVYCYKEIAAEIGQS